MLVPWISDTRSMLSSMGLSNILVGNADAGSYFNNEVLSAVDYGVGILLCMFGACLCCADGERPPMVCQSID